MATKKAAARKSTGSKSPARSATKKRTSKPAPKKASAKPKAKSKAPTKKKAAAKRAAAKPKAKPKTRVPAKKKAAAKKPAAKSKSKSKSRTAAKPAAGSKPKPKPKSKPAAAASASSNGRKTTVAAKRGKAASVRGVTPGFTRKQKSKLLALRDELMDQLAGVTRDTLRKPAGGDDASAFGMHQADAGSDAYDRDFALNLLSQEQNALHEIEEALKRIDTGTYGVCEMSGKKIAQARLEAIPFARFTVECQTQVEREQKLGGFRRPPQVVFGADGEDGEKFGFSSNSEVESKKR